MARTEPAGPKARREYTRDQTILASSRTLGGTQHPTFHYDLRGRADVADVVLANLGTKGRGTLTFPGDATWLVARGTDVVGEIVSNAKRKSLSLRPGKYFVRGRTRDALLEGTVTVTEPPPSEASTPWRKRTASTKGA